MNNRTIDRMTNRMYIWMPDELRESIIRTAKSKGISAPDLVRYAVNSFIQSESRPQLDTQAAPTNGNAA